MKKFGLLFTFILFLFFSIETSTVQADMGPKPSLDITIVGVTEDYYFDLLIYEPGTVESEDISNGSEWYYIENEFPSALNGYQDSDGYASYSLYHAPSRINNPSDNYFEMNYIAPDEFKIVLVMKDNQAIISSTIIKTNRFESEVEWDLTNIDLSNSISNVGLLSGNIDGVDNGIENSTWFITIINTLYRIIMTLIIEIGIFYLFMFRKKSSYKIVTITNIITQILLSILVINAYLSGGYMLYLIALLLGEGIVIIAEFIVYAIYIKEKSRWRLFFYAYIANVMTILASLLMTNLI